MARLTMRDRNTLSRMYVRGKSVLEIAAKLGCHHQTVYEELMRGCTGKLDENGRMAYDPVLGQKTVQANMRRCGRKRRVTG